MRLKSNLWKDTYGNIFYRKRINGNRIVVPAYTKDVKNANKLLPALEYQALLQHYAPVNKTKFKTFSELVKLYLNDEEVNSKWADSSRETSKYVLNSFSLTRKLPNNKETQRGYKTRINACLNWGKSKGYVTNVEIMKVNKKQGRTRVFSNRELNIIFNEFQDDNFCSFLKFTYYTGARRGEINSLQPHQIEPARIKVSGKSGIRYVKLNSQARSLLMEQEKLWDYKVGYISQKFLKESRRLDILDARFHDLRRTFGLNLIKDGMPIFQVSKLLGHSSVKVTEQHYAPLLIDDIEDFYLK